MQTHRPLLFFYAKTPVKKKKLQISGCISEKFQAGAVKYGSNTTERSILMELTGNYRHELKYQIGPAATLRSGSG